MDAQFEHLCRICAANTKSKNNSVVESVFIFKTIGLKDKISRHLFLNVEEEDPLPKVLCKSCYRQVEATASLSNIAKHTQRVFQDFVLSTVPKQTRESMVSTASHAGQLRSDYYSNNAKPSCNNLDSDTFQPILLKRPPATTITPGSYLQTNSKDDDIVLSLNNAESEMRHRQPQDQPQKHQRISTGVACSYSNNRSNIKLNNLMLPTRRNSVFVDTRYSSAPMSIAQRSMQQPPSLAPLLPELTISKPTKKSPEKKSSPAGVINFIQTHGRITGNAPMITPCGNKGYNEDSSSSTSTKISSATSSAPHTVNKSGVPNLPNSVIQQKRRNLKNALNNISAIRDGQVSLLKSAHQRQSVPDVDIRPLVTTTVVPHLSLYGIEPSVEEALPEHIIIAAPKKKKEEPPALARLGPPKLQKISAPAKSGQSSSDISNPVEGPTATCNSKTLPSITNLTDTISLGNVIRDPDLLKLILKALKWPVTPGNCEEQMTKLKNSKFAVIMSDSNLLQDNDLTQLLGPYLSPVVAAVHHQQKQSSTTATTNSSPPPSPQTIGDCTMPYKLPPETSVQLVPSSPTESESPNTLPSKILGSNSKRSQRQSQVPEITDEQQANRTVTPTTSNAALVTNELLNINAMLISQFGTNPADALNEALISMLKQQQDLKSQRSYKRRRSASATNTPINLEDIILVEPQPSDSLQTTSSSNISFKIPSQKISEYQPVTRPIIKRRKIVMQSPDHNAYKADIEKGIKVLPSKENPTKLDTDRCIDTIKTTNESDLSKSGSNPDIQQVVETPQAPTSTVSETISAKGQYRSDHECTNEEVATNNPIGDSSNKAYTTSVRKTDAKSALGQKLLEAIGLPQSGKNFPPEHSRDTLRSALKRSLKQAQEQQQQLKRVKQEEPVKQMADSTTKPGAGESSEEHKKAIAERELELLKRKTKSADRHISIRDERSERTDVSSSSSRNRRNRNKLKTDANEEDSAADEKKSERWDEDDDLPLKNDLDKSPEHINRPARTSKTMSKYYKSPGTDKTSVQKSQHAMGTRSTRQR